MCSRALPFGLSVRFCSNTCAAPRFLTWASRLTPHFSLHRREGGGSRAVPLPLVLPLLPACLQVLRRRLEALGGESSLDGRARPPPLQRAGEALFLVSRLGMELSWLGFIGGSEEVSASICHPVASGPSAGQRGQKEGPSALAGGGQACCPATLPRQASLCSTSPHPWRRRGPPKGRTRCSSLIRGHQSMNLPGKRLTTHFCSAQPNTQPRIQRPTSQLPTTLPSLMACWFPCPSPWPPPDLWGHPWMVGLSTVALLRLLSNALDSHGVILPPSLSPSSLPLPFSFPPSLSPPLPLFLPSS